MPRISLQNIRALNGQAGFGNLIEPSPLNQSLITPAVIGAPVPVSKYDDDRWKEEQKRYEAEQKRNAEIAEGCAIWEQFDSCPQTKAADGQLTTSVCGTPACRISPLSLVMAPGRIIGNLITPIFPDEYEGQAQAAGHVIAALLIIGGVAYGFTRVGNRR